MKKLGIKPKNIKRFWDNTNRKFWDNTKGENIDEKNCIV